MDLATFRSGLKSQELESTPDFFHRLITARGWTLANT